MLVKFLVPEMFGGAVEHCDEEEEQQQLHRDGCPYQQNHESCLS